MVTDGAVTANVCVITKRPVVIRLPDKNGLSAVSVLSDPVSFVVFVVIAAAVVVDVVVFIAAFIVGVVAVATVFVLLELQLRFDTFLNYLTRSLWSRPK